MGMVLTFYSYKGGVGRSMALANVAFLLACWGRKVLTVDFDLEAPGLEHYWAGLKKDFERKYRPGVVDLLCSFRDRKETCWRDCLISIDVPVNVKGEGFLHFISAGRETNDYIKLVQSLNYDVLFDDEEISFGQSLLRMRQEWLESYDFILIDSRTGISDVGGICTIIFPDILVAIFTANKQSVLGCAEVIRRARSAQEKLPEDRRFLRALPLLSRDDRRAEGDQSEEWRIKIAGEIEELFRGWLWESGKAKKVLDGLYLPYVARWSFGEKLSVHERPSELNDPGSLSAAYARLARLIDADLEWDLVEPAVISSPGDQAEDLQSRGENLPAPKEIREGDHRESSERADADTLAQMSREITSLISGKDYENDKDYKNTKDLLEEVFEVCLAKYGPSDQKTLEAMGSLADFHWNRMDKEQAQYWVRRGLLVLREASSTSQAAEELRGRAVPMGVLLNEDPSMSTAFAGFLPEQFPPFPVTNQLPPRHGSFTFPEG
ncbi:tyrosine-protein kinase family protein [Pararhodospirillum photometricum]|uniref:tyrosine-protein kinase family protein n=1 Tax=Pararhodospirillum photometricum TaxID=1084 RepID=UPI00031ADC85|nr:hypothetical protein [Pararhodospirillum photometricum]